MMRHVSTLQSNISHAQFWNICVVDYRHGVSVWRWLRLMRIAVRVILNFKDSAPEPTLPLTTVVSQQHKTSSVLSHTRVGCKNN